MVLVGLGIVGGLVFAALPKPVPVEGARVTRGELVVTVDEDGKARVKDRYVVSAPLLGNLARIELRAGDEVKQGQVLARLVPLRSPLLDARSRSQSQARISAADAATRQARAQIERGKAALEFAKNEAKRHRALFEQQAISQMELDRVLLEERSRIAELTSAEFGANVAAHEARMARAALGHQEAPEDLDGFTVPSPVTGRVLRIIQQSEGVVQPGTPLLELGDPKALEIVVDVLTSDAVNVRPGSPARIVEWGGAALEASVRTIEPSAFTRLSALGVEEQRVNALLDLSSPYEAWRSLGDGYRVEARIEVYRANGALVVPESALFRHEGKWAVFVLVEGRAKLQQLEVGRRSESFAEVTAGLGEGISVSVHPSDSVVDGVSVAPL